MRGSLPSEKHKNCRKSIPGTPAAWRWADRTLPSRKPEILRSRSTDHRSAVVEAKTAPPGESPPWAAPRDTHSRRPKDPSGQKESANPETPTGDSPGRFPCRAPEQTPVQSWRRSLALPPLNQTSAPEHSAPDQCHLALAKQVVPPIPEKSAPRREYRTPSSLPGAWPYPAQQQMNRYRESTPHPAQGSKPLSQCSSYLPSTLSRSPHTPWQTGQSNHPTIYVDSTPTPPVWQSQTTEIATLPVAWTCPTTRACLPKLESPALGVVCASEGLEVAGRGAAQRGEAD
jgi:hypothetical protein